MKSGDYRGATTASRPSIPRTGGSLGSIHLHKQSGLLLEKSFRMAQSDLQARPVFHHLRDSIEAHLTVVFAALAVSRWIEARTG